MNDQSCNDSTSFVDMSTGNVWAHMNYSNSPLIIRTHRHISDSSEDLWAQTIRKHYHGICFHRLSAMLYYSHVPLVSRTSGLIPCVLFKMRKLDWEKEAAAMADIYSNCQITLAASLAQDSEGGLFVKREVEGCQIGVVHDQIGRYTPLYMRASPDHDPQATCYPVATRAWVLQETLLSPRTLYFLGTEVLYECREGAQCECGQLVRYENGKQMLATERKGWQWIVARYSRTSMTFSKDVLPALSGMAKQRLSHLHNDTYLAGLWRSPLLSDLLWYSKNRSTTSRRRARPWRAPS
jgi:hypothetical protein